MSDFPAPTQGQIRKMSEWLNIDVGYTELFTKSPAFLEILRDAYSEGYRDGWNAGTERADD